MERKTDTVREAFNAEVAWKDGCVWITRIWGTLRPLPFQVRGYKCWRDAIQVLKTKQNSDRSKTLQWYFSTNISWETYTDSCWAEQKGSRDVKDMTLALENLLGWRWRKSWLSIFIFPAIIGRRQHPVPLAKGQSLWEAVFCIQVKLEWNTWTLS